MLTVTCVLRESEVYGPKWVRRLQEQVSRHLSEPHEFVCLSDVEVEDVRTVHLLHDLPGWWAKAELFRPGVLSGRALYFDLDTLIVGNIDELATYRGAFATLRDFWSPDVSASGVMLWDADNPPGIYGTVRDDPPPFRGRFDVWWNGVATPADHLQDLYPGMFGSYKAQSLEEWRGRSRPALARGPNGYSVVCFHGRPRITDVLDTWVGGVWTA